MSGFYYFAECNLIVHVTPSPKNNGVWLWEHRVGRQTVFEYTIKELARDPHVIYLGEL